MKEVSGPPVSRRRGRRDGFAKKMGVALDQLQKVQTAKGEYYSFNRAVPDGGPSTCSPKRCRCSSRRSTFRRRCIGREKAESASSGQSVGSWRFLEMRWSRSRSPACELATKTNGHRLLGKAEVPVTIENFAAQLHANGVVLSASQRRAMIESGLRSERSARRRVAEHTCVFDRASIDDPRLVRSEVPGVAQRNSKHGDAASPALLLGGTGGQPVGARVRRGDEHEGRSRRTWYGSGMNACFAPASTTRGSSGMSTAPEASRPARDLKNVTFQAKLGSLLRKNTSRRSALAADRGRSVAMWQSVPVQPSCRSAISPPRW